MPNYPVIGDLKPNRKSFNQIQEGVWIDNTAFNCFDFKSIPKTPGNINLNSIPKKSGTPFEFQRPDKITSYDLQSRSFFNEQFRQQKMEKLAENIGDTASSDWLHKPSKKEKEFEAKKKQFDEDAKFITAELTAKAKLFEGKKPAGRKPGSKNKVKEVFQTPDKGQSSKSKSPLQSPSPSPKTAIKAKKKNDKNITFRKEKA